VSGIGIVGAGISGLHLALRLQQRGIATIVMVAAKVSVRADPPLEFYGRMEPPGESVDFRVYLPRPGPLAVRCAATDTDRRLLPRHRADARTRHAVPVLPGRRRDLRTVRAGWAALPGGKYAMAVGDTCVVS
jgi:hypothetical protein